MGYELISALSALDLSQGCNYLPTPALTLHTHHMRGEELQEGEQLPLFFPPISYRFRRLSGDVDFVSLFISFHRVWQLERTGQGFGQQEHSSCGSKSPVLPSPKAGPPGMWQGQPIFPACAWTWGLNCLGYISNSEWSYWRLSLGLSWKTNTFTPSLCAYIYGVGWEEGEVLTAYQQLHPKLSTWESFIHIPSTTSNLQHANSFIISMSVYCSKAAKLF